MKWFKKPRGVLFLSFLLLSLFFAFQVAPKAFANLPSDGGGNGFGSLAPASGSGCYNPNNTNKFDIDCSNSGTTITPFFDVGNNNQEYAYSAMTVVVYVNKAWSGQVHVTIKNAAPDCHSFSSGSIVGPDYTNKNGPVPTTFSLIGNNGQLAINTVSSGGCGVNGEVSFSAANWKAASLSAGFDTTNWGGRYDGAFIIQIQVGNTINEGENQFRAEITDDGSPNAGAAPGSDIFGVGYRANPSAGGNIDNGNHFNTWFNFSKPVNCNSLITPQTSTETVYYYDTDPGDTPAHLEWNDSMIFELQRERINDDGSVATGWQAMQQDSQSAGTLHQNGNFTFTASTQYRYRIVLGNVGVRNTIRIKYSTGIDPLYSRLSERATTAKCPKPYAADCSTNPSYKDSLSPNQTQIVHITVHNGGSQPWDPDTTGAGQIQLNRYVNGTYINSKPLSNIRGSPLPPGQSDTYDINETAPAGQGQSKTITYKMARSQIGVMPDTSATLKNNCKTVLVTGQCAPNDPACNPTGPPGGGNGYLQTSCGNTTIKGVTSDATYLSTDQFGFPVNKPITRVPVRITVHVIDGPGAGSDLTPVYTWVENSKGGAGSGEKNLGNTFDLAGGMWLHGVYQIRLEVEGAQDPLTSAIYTDNGDWAFPNPGGATFYGVKETYNTSNFDSDVKNCLDADCGQATPVDLEPGQRGAFSYGIKITNRTGRGDFSANNNSGYHFVVTPHGGLAAISGQTTSPGNLPADANPPNDNLHVDFSGRLDSTGSFSVQFYFDNAVLTSLASMPGGTCDSGPLTPASRAYFQVWNGDALAGGGFKNYPSNSCRGPSDPPYITPSGGNDSLGGIVAYGHQAASPSRGSLADFGAIAMGQIPGNKDGPFGFFSGHGTIFANTGVPGLNSTSMGGYLHGNSDAHCVDDYFTKTRKTGSPSTFSGNFTVPGQYTLPSGSTIGSGTIPAGTQITIYVDGDVTIDGNISYAPSWDPDNTDDVPYFALIVRGNIFIANSSTRLSGLYVAQPNLNDVANTGSLVTCTINSPDNSFCPNDLVINGAVIAERVRLLRVHGTLGPLEADPAGLCSPTVNTLCPPAEVINFVPSMFIGTPFFTPEYQPIESLFSLPPVL